MTIAVNRAVSSREYVCNQCGGAVAGVAVFRHLLGDHQVGEIWSSETPTSSADGAGQPLRCGFCLAAMELRSVPSGQAAICKTCQVMWLDKTALGSITTTVASPTLAEVGVTKCSNCGAPISSPLAEKCEHCGAALEVAPVVVMAPTAETVGVGWPEVGTGAGSAGHWFARAVSAVINSSSR